MQQNMPIPCPAPAVACKRSCLYPPGAPSESSRDFAESRSPTMGISPTDGKVHNSDGSLGIFAKLCDDCSLITTCIFAATLCYPL